MTTDITPERIAELRQQHTPSVVYHDKKVCPKCSYEEYPCTMLALLDALEEAHGTASACYGQEMCRGFRDTYEAVAGERDRLRKELEEARESVVTAQDWERVAVKERDELRAAWDWTDAQMRQLRAENERLRAALNDAKAVLSDIFHPCEDECDCVLHVINAALAASPEQEGQ